MKGGWLFLEAGRLVSGRPRGTWRACAGLWRWCFKNISGPPQVDTRKKTNVSCAVKPLRKEEFHKQSGGGPRRFDRLSHLFGGGGMVSGIVWGSRGIFF